MKEIGRKIKELRNSKNITQEKLAEYLGVSFQSVSKWENGITMPDINIIPAIASYFSISIDDLFSFDLREQDEKVKAVCGEAYTLRVSNPEKAADILKSGLKQFPGNETILNNLLYVSRDDELIQIAEKLVSEATADDIKYDALRFLAHAYKKKGETEYAKATVARIPELYFTKLGVAAYVYEGKEKFETAQKEKWIAFQEMIEMMFKLYEYYNEIGENEKAQREITDGIKILEIFDNPNFNKDFLPYLKKHLKT